MGRARGEVLRRPGLHVVGPAPRLKRLAAVSAFMGGFARATGADLDLRENMATMQNRARLFPTAEDISRMEQLERAVPGSKRRVLELPPNSGNCGAQNHHSRNVSPR